MTEPVHPERSMTIFKPWLQRDNWMSERNILVWMFSQHLHSPPNSIEIIIVASSVSCWQCPRSPAKYFTCILVLLSLFLSLSSFSWRENWSLGELIYLPKVIQSVSKRAKIKTYHTQKAIFFPLLWRLDFLTEKQRLDFFALSHRMTQETKDPRQGSTPSSS